MTFHFLHCFYKGYSCISWILEWEGEVNFTEGETISYVDRVRAGILEKVWKSANHFF